jgi:hypothetical protein
MMSDTTVVRTRPAVDRAVDTPSVLTRGADYPAMTRRARARLGVVESAWIFRRGRQSVRIVRIGHRDSSLSLLVDGPGAARVRHEFDDQMACAIHQCEIERELAARDFYLEQIGRTRG